MALSQVFLQKLRHVLRGEGNVRWMYLDVKGKVSTGIGFLIDSVQSAEQCPWQNITADNTVEIEWKKVKGLQSLKDAGGAAFESQTKLRVTQAYVDQAFVNKANGLEATYKQWRFLRNFDSFPADARVAIITRGWAALERHYRFCRACDQRDWLWAAEEAPWPGIVQERRSDLECLLNNAAIVDAPGSGRDPDTIYYPARLGAPPPTPRSTFRSLIRAKRTEHALTLLNSFWIRDQLRALDTLAYDELVTLRVGIEGFTGSAALNWPRLMFATSVTLHRTLPADASEKHTKGLLTDDDMAQAMEYLVWRGFASGKK